MRVEIEIPAPEGPFDAFRARAILFNDGFEAVTISRNAFVGPKFRLGAASGHQVLLDSVEATFGMQEDLVVLQPHTFYGREREIADPGPGEVEVSAYYQDGDRREHATVMRSAGGGAS
ncbi:hypothetical protein ACIBG8_42945 [Nonomuraea sp. NPDC050556]|uniref:hypothetical protein n=1 Tax=Nonomuraea sp. NPDC050556 TaxID=3364369 RepID=UPI0037A630F0